MPGAAQKPRLFSRIVDQSLQIVMNITVNRLVRSYTGALRVVPAIFSRR
jgi:hypothetical protein